MNLTRLGELLDLADHAALTPSQAREMADEQAMLRTATAWTAEAPQRPGLYAWQAGTDAAARIIRVTDHAPGTLATWDAAAELWRDVAEMGGVWSGPIAPLPAPRAMVE
jgi:hypothetical protein